MSLRGRDRECSSLDGLVSAIQRDESRALVLRGEAGIGKTALLEYLVGSASGLTVARAAGIESEMELAYASLHQLCVPLLDRRDRLPDPQRQALEIVFGERGGDPPDRFLVGLGVLGLFSCVAEERPLLCVIDDAQWLDRASSQTLAFVARRIGAEPVGIVFAAREPADELQQLPELEVQGLRNGDARALLAFEVPSVVDERVRDRIIAETRGNPLALLELPRDATLTELTAGFGIPDGGDVARRIEESYARRVETLPEEAQRLLVVAAAEPVGDPLLLQRACERLEVPLSAIDATGGLLTVAERVAFRHPLARSAVYRGAAAPERRAAHAALAEVTDHLLDPDRRAWHLSAAATGPDEEVARILELSAGRAKARGGLAAAAAFLQRAVALTADPTRQAARALAAAQASLEAGAFDAAHRLLRIAHSGLLDELGRARVDLLRAQLAFAHKQSNEAPGLLLQAARRLETLDVRLARDTYLDAWSAALGAGPLASPGSSLLDASRAIMLAPEATEPLARDLLLDGLALLLTEGRPSAVPLLERAVAAFGSPEVTTEEMIRWGWLASRAANLVWDYDASLAIATRAVQLARDFGALEVLALVDNACGQASAMGGDFTTAAQYTAELDAAKEATGSRIAPLAALALAGVRGQEAVASELIERIVAEASAGGQGTAVHYARWAQSVLMNGLGRYEEALEAAAYASETTPQLFIAMWALSELIEASVRTENAELARSALDRLREQTRDGDTDWALGLYARGRALLSDGDAAEGLYREAVERLGRTRVRPELARSHLLYGEWLRRGNRRVDARTQLRTAHELFVAIGMEAFAERARGELLATGEKVRGRAVDRRAELTAQELQIARLARAGLSNPEIGSRLFLSPRTVEWHLHKVFAKLDIGSRRELHLALPESGAAAMPA